jgi:uncharacterized protein YjbJ (UPF0337 family)
LDKDNLEGKTKDVTGRIKRQVGEWTGDNDLQAEGTADQAEGKVQNAWGNVKEKARDIADDMKRDDDVDRKKDVA